MQVIYGLPSEMRWLKAAPGTIGLVPNLSIYWNIEEQGLYVRRWSLFPCPVILSIAMQPALSNGMLQTGLKIAYTIGHSLSCSSYHHEKHLPRLRCWPRRRIRGTWGRAVPAKGSRASSAWRRQRLQLIHKQPAEISRAQPRSAKPQQDSLKHYGFKSLSFGWYATMKQ